MSQAHINPAAIAASIEQAKSHPSLPPVSQWNPSLCGDIDIIIQSNGQWLFQGSPINRPQLVRLFSTVLRCEQGEYYLVTPVEKLKIIVEDAPFIAVAAKTILKNDGEREQQQWIFTTNVGDNIILGTDHPLTMVTTTEHSSTTEPPLVLEQQPRPYIRVREQLDALINRNVFYELVDKADITEVDGACHLGLWSQAQFFSLGLMPES